jgi:hypothetical protein
MEELPAFPPGSWIICRIVSNRVLSKAEMNYSRMETGGTQTEEDLFSLSLYSQYMSSNSSSSST